MVSANPYPGSLLSRARAKAAQYAGIRWGTMRRTTPINRGWGFERGSPIDRYYIERFLSTASADISGHVLEVNDSNYTQRFGGQQVTRSSVIDVDSTNPKATVITDLNNAVELTTAYFDCIILTQTLQFVYDVHSALRHLHRSLAPSGVLLLTVPGITRISSRAERSWYWSFTPASVQRVLEQYFGSSLVDVSSRGNILAATAFLHGLGSDQLRPRELDFHDSEFPVIVSARAQKSDAA